MLQSFQSEIIQLIVKRGYYYQATNLKALDAYASTKKIKLYAGFDLTATSLHIGHLLPIMMLRKFQQAGHTPIILLGGGTTLVGDPSGKDKTRPLLTLEMISEYKKNILKTFQYYLDFNTENAPIIQDNTEWLTKLNYIELLRDFGKHFTINKMIQMENVKRRLDREQPLTFLEFNYMLLQAYDFLELYNRMACRLQIGGSDQWGNIINGVDIIRRIKNTEVYGLTCPLITTASGAKMGKTEKGAIWLNPELLSSYDYWQFWRNIDDRDVGRFMRLFTDIPLNEIEYYEQLKGEEINLAKEKLANETTSLLHGQLAAKQALTTAKETFSGTGISDGLPSININQQEIKQEISILDLAIKTGLVQSRGEAKRHIKANALKLNDQIIKDPKRMLEVNDFLSSNLTAKLSIGKKKHVLIRIKQN